MKRLNFEEVRAIQIDMLDKVHKFCEENNINYFLDAGTLLGAIRHNGFIPWDDDVDICMPRPDYEKFIDLARNGFGKSLRLCLPVDSIYPMLKIVDTSTLLIEFPNTHKNRSNIYIDVFPKDGIPSISILSTLRCKIVFYWILVNWFFKISIFTWKKSRNPIKKLTALFGRMIVSDSIKNFSLNKINKLATKYKYDESPFIATIVAGGMKNCVRKECFKSFEIYKYENLKLRIPLGYDEYLKKLYGDYMTLPPLNRRIKHDYEAYLLDEK